MGFPDLTENLLKMNHARQEEAKWWMEHTDPEERAGRLEKLQRSEAILRGAELDAFNGKETGESLP